MSGEALARRLGSGAAVSGTGLRTGFAAAKPGSKRGAAVDGPRDRQHRRKVRGALKRLW